jgi:hypothetical protein
MSHGLLPPCGDLALVGQTNGFLSGIAFSPDGALLASTHGRGGKCVLQLNEVHSRRTLMMREGLVASGWSEDGNYLLALSATSVAGTPPHDVIAINNNLDPGVWIRSAFAQAWEVSCPVPTFQMRKPVKRLRFRTDGRQLVVDGTLWDVQPASGRIALHQNALPASGHLLGFRGSEVWGLLPEVERPDQDRLLDDVRLKDINARRSAEMTAILGARLVAAGIGLGALTKLGYPFADLAPTRWESIQVSELFPAKKDVVLAPPDHSPSKHFKDGPGVAFLWPYRVSWSRGGEKMLAIVGQGKCSLQISTSDDSFARLFVPETGDRFIDAWDIPSGKRYPLKLPAGRWTDIAWHPEGRRFATAGWYGVQIWDLATSTERARLSEKHTDNLVWSDDGQYLLAIKEDKKNPKEDYTATIYTQSGRETCSWSAPAKDGSAFSISGQLRCVVTGGEDGHIQIRDVESGRDLARWQAHDAAVTALTFSPDGTLLVSGAADGGLRVWNLPWIRTELAALGLDW